MKKKKQAVITSTGVPVRQKPLGLRIWNHRGYYIMFLPVLIFLIIMNYWPMLGIRYAFYDYKPVGEPVFVGFKHFEKMFSTEAFWVSFKKRHPGGIVGSYSSSTAGKYLFKP